MPTGLHSLMSFMLPNVLRISASATMCSQLCQFIQSTVLHPIFLAYSCGKMYQKAANSKEKQISWIVSEP